MLTAEGEDQGLMTTNESKDKSIPPYHQMLWPTLQALKSLGDSGSNQEIEDNAIEIAGYTESQLNLLHGNGPQTEVRYRMALARTYLKSVGAIENSSRAVWSITDYGKGLTEADMLSIPTRVRATLSHRVRSAASKGLAENQIKEAEAPLTNGSFAFSSTVFEEWRDNLLNVVLAISPANFEKLCQRVLRESGFTRVEITGRSGDGGIDGIGVLRIALLSFHVFFQCKRYKGNVGAPAIRDFRGAMVGRTDKGLFITTGNFTPDAMREATRDGAPVLDLIDGETLCKILKDLNLGVGTRQVEEVSIDADWFDAL
jgi:restriction system protein